MCTISFKERDISKDLEKQLWRACLVGRVKYRGVVIEWRTSQHGARRFAFTLPSKVGRYGKTVLSYLPKVKSLIDKDYQRQANKRKEAQGSLFEVAESG